METNVNDKCLIDALKFIAYQRISGPAHTAEEELIDEMILTARAALVKVGFSALEWKDL